VVACVANHLQVYLNSVLFLSGFETMKSAVILNLSVAIDYKVYTLFLQ